MVVCTGARLVPSSDCVLGLGLKVSVRAVNKKPRTRNQHATDAFLSHNAQLFFPKTALHSIFGPPSDILGVYYQNGSIASKHPYHPL